MVSERILQHRQRLIGTLLVLSSCAADPQAATRPPPIQPSTEATAPSARGLEADTWSEANAENVVEAALFTLGVPEIRIRMTKRVHAGMFFTARGSITDRRYRRPSGLSRRDFRVAGSLELSGEDVHLGAVLVEGIDDFPIDLTVAGGHHMLAPIQVGEQAALVGFTAPVVTRVDLLAPTGEVVRALGPSDSGDVIVPSPAGSVIVMRRGREVLFTQLIIDGISADVRPAPAVVARRTAVQFVQSLLRGEAESAAATLLLANSPSSEGLAVQAADLVREGWRIAGAAEPMGSAMVVPLRQGRLEASFHVEVGLNESRPVVVTYGFRRETVTRARRPA